MKARTLGFALSLLAPAAYAQTPDAPVTQGSEQPDASDETTGPGAAAPTAAAPTAAAATATVAAPPTAAAAAVAPAVAPAAAPSPATQESEPPSDGAEASSAAMDAEVESFLAEEQLGQSGFDPSLALYGFADFTYGQYFMAQDSPWRLLFNNGGNFAVGNLNLYLDSQLHETVRALAEVRFTYLPHGSLSIGPPSTRRKNSVEDYTRYERDSDLGAIIIQRAWLEWSPFEIFSIKAGHWLTPYGIWNVDHGSPVIVPVTRPFMIDQQILPESQTGLLAEGRYDVTDKVALEYAFGVSNGRGPTDTVFDQDSNRGLTYRLKMVYTGAGELQIGASGYNGRYTEAQIDLDIEGDRLVSDKTMLVEYKEQSWAADIRYRNGGLLLQSEAMLNDRSYTEEGRSQGALPGTLSPDTRRGGVYLLAGYRFEWLGVMPYLIGEFSPIPDTGVPELPQEVILVGGGLNIRPIAQVVIKAGYDQAWFPENRDATFDQSPVRRLQGQIAWAF